MGRLAASDTMKILARRSARRTLVALVVLLVIAVFVHTPPARLAALWIATTAGSRLSGGELGIESLDYRLWKGEARVSGLTWTAPEREVTLSAREVLLDFSAFAPTWVRVESPDVRVEASPDSSSEPANVVLPAFLLRSRVELRDGRVAITDTLEVDALDLDLRPDGTLSRGEARAARIVLQEESIGPARARFTLRPTSLALEEARIEKDASFATATGTVSSFSPLELELELAHRIEPDLLEEVEPRLSAQAAIEGTAVVRKAPGSDWEAEGRLLAPSIRLDELGPLLVRAPWRFERRVLGVEGMEVVGYGGRAVLEARLDSANDRLEAEGSFEEIDIARLARPVASRASGRFEARLTGLDPETLEGSAAVTLRPSSAEGLPLRGDVRIRMEASRVRFEAPRLAAAPGLEISSSGTFDEALDARFRARVTPPVPAEGALLAEGTARGPLDSIAVAATLSSEDLKLREESFRLTGAIGFRGARLRLRDVELAHEGGGRILVEGEAPTAAAGGAFDLSARVESFDLSAIAPAPYSGLFDGTFEVQGGFSRPELAGSLVASSFAYGDELRARAETTVRLIGPLDALEGELTARVFDWTVRNVPFPDVALELEADTVTTRLGVRFEDGRELLEAELELDPPHRLRADSRLETLPIAEIRQVFPALAEADTMVELAGGGRVELSLLEPGEFRYQIDVERALGTYRGIFLGASSPFSIEGDRNSFEVRDLTLVGEDTAIGIEGVVPLSRDGGVALHARGATRLELLRPWFPEAEPAGRANLDVSVEGALPDPWLRGEIGIDGASVIVGAVLVENVVALGEWSDEALRFDDVRGELLGGRFRLRGELAPQLDASAPTKVAFEVEDVDPLRLGGEDAAWPEGAEAEVAISGILEGVGFDPSTWRGQGALGWAFARMNEVELKNDGPAPWSFANGRFELLGLVLSGGEGRLVLDGEARPFDETPSWRATGTGRVDHSITALFLEESGVSFSGATDLDVRAGAGPEPLFVEGRGSFASARLAVRDPAIAFNDVSGEIVLDESTVRLTKLTADAGGGTVEAAGTIDFSGERTTVDLRANARSVRLTYPEGLRSEVNGDVRLSGPVEALRLTGDVVLARALFSRDINVETEILQSVSRAGVLSDPGAFASSVALDLRVRAGEAFRIDNNLARMEASVNLAILGTLAAPEIHGLAAARAGGEFRFGGNTYRVETGRIQLRGYPAEPPVLDIRARTQVSGYDIQLVLRGPTDGLTTELTAPGKPSGAEDPSRADIASLLLTGRTLDRISSEGRSIVGERMASYLGGTLAELAELGIGETLPFDIVTVEPSLIARETDPSARFTLGARFQDRLSLVYSIGLNDTDDQIWIVDYELPRRARTQLIRDAENDFTLGLSQSLRFDVIGSKAPEEAPRREIATVGVTFREGGGGVAAEEIRGRLRIDPGDRYDYWKAWDAAERLREHLRSMGFLEATVEAKATEVDGGIDLEYLVAVGPRVRFEIEGDELDGSLKKEILELWNGSSSETFLTADIALRVEGELYEGRYYEAAAEVNAENVSDEETVVTVVVTRGPRGKRVEVDFRGNDALGDAVLLPSLPKPQSAAFHELVTAKRPRLRQLLRMQYASRGFVEASISDPELAFDEASGVLSIVVPVDEGRLFRVEGIELEGVESVDERDVRARLSLEEGEPFRVTSFVQDRSAIASFYRERGFADVEVTASVLDRPEGGRLGARYVVREGPQVAVSELEIEGNVATRESVIRRELAIQPGEPLRPSDLTETQRRLYELGIFQSADVVVGEPGADASRRGVRIEVREVPDVEVDYGVRAGTDGSFQVLGELRAPNLFGRAQNAGIRALVGSERSVYRLTYRSPYLSRFRLSTDFFVERELEEQAATADAFGFADRTWTFTGQQTRPLTERLNLQWSYSFRRTVTQIDDPDDFGDFTFTQNRAILTTALIGDSRNSVIRPTRGAFWSVTLQGAPESLGSDLKFLKLFGQLYTFVPVGPRVTWAGGYRLGATNSFGQRLTEDDRFQAGGPNSVRGFETGSLGPIDAVLGIPIGGASVAVFNQELRFPLFWKLGGVSFWDAGNTFATSSELSLSDLRHSAGAGLRFELPFGLLRLDWAKVVGRRAGEDPWQLVFSLGHAF